MPGYDDINPVPDSIHVLLYGAPGTGKTIQAHSWPRPRTLDFDNGVRSILWAVKAGIIPKPENWDYETIIETDMGSHGFVQNAKAFDAATDKLDEWLKEPDEWDTLIIDSVTALNQYAINKALENMDKLGQSKSYKQGKQLQMQVTKMQDYGGAMTLFNHFMDWIRSLGKHVICVAHEYEQTDDEGRLRKVQPLLIGQLRQRIVKDFDEVWYATTRGSRDNTKYITQTKGDSIVTAKSRLGVFSAQEDFLTYDKVVAKLGAPADG